MKATASRAVLLAGLVLLATLGTWAYSETRPGVSGSLRSDGREVVDCSTMEKWHPSGKYENGSKYEAGSEVQNRGAAFSCEIAGWCSQQDTPAYEPGVPDGIYWQEAWNELGTCGEPPPVFLGNQLTVSFPKAPSNADPDQELIGSVRCQGDEEAIAITGKWGETSTIDSLKRCNYVVVLKSAGNQSPLNTPNIVSFDEVEGQAKEFRPAYGPTIDVDSLTTMPGVKVELFATGLLQPRQMAMGKGVLYVGSSAIPNRAYEGRVADYIYALPLDESGKPRDLVVMQSGLIEPHGVAYRDGSLYYSTTGALFRVDNADATYSAAAPTRVLKFPADDVRFPLPNAEGDVGKNSRLWHQKHPLFFNPTDANDKHLYTAVGTPCNLCSVPPGKDDRYGTVLRYDLEKATSTFMAVGVRNSVGMAWHPDSKELWFTDNNRQPIANPDYLNPDEVNRIKNAGEDYGFPYFFGADTAGFNGDEWRNISTANGAALAPGLVRPYLGPGEADPINYNAPALELPNASAPLGLAFWTGYPAESGERNLLVAVHGGGMPDTNPGNLVRLLKIKNGKVVQNLPFIQGWTGSNGSPVEFLELKDKEGSILISDDIAGVIYRVYYDPTAVAKTSLTINLPGELPEGAEDSLIKKRITGALINSAGVRRIFDADWSGQPVHFEGLPAGNYTLEMKDVGKYVPKGASISIALAENDSQEVAVEYIPRPDVNYIVTITAPPKPGDAAGDTMKVVFKNKDPDGGEAPPADLEIAWGATATAPFKYGLYNILIPFQVGYLPSPSLFSISVSDNGAEQISANYEAADVGLVMRDEACKQCHEPGALSGETYALKYEGKIDQLKTMIATMGTKLNNGHCDGVCVDEIANHLYNKVWASYLDPPESIGRRQLRRLTQEEYKASIMQVFAVKVEAEMPADPIDVKYRFPGEAVSGKILKAEVYQYLKAAQEVAKKWVPARNGRSDVTFVDAMGLRLFRQPLSDRQRDQYVAVMEEAGSGEMGQRLVVNAMLMSPNFLYRLELGDQVESSEIYDLNDYEVATALSFTFLGVTPSDDLLSKAGKGELSTSEQIIETARAMLISEVGAKRFTRFIQYYTGSTQLLAGTGLDTPIASAMETERSMFVKYMLSQKGYGTINGWFNPGYTYLNKALADYYGVENVTGDEVKRVDVTNVTDRNGLMMRGGLLHQGAFHVGSSSSMIKRGFIIRENIMGHEFGTPIAMPKDPEFSGPASMRMRWERVNGRLADPSCWTCHQYVNDTGALLENYDSKGKWRYEEPAVNSADYPDTMVKIDASSMALLDSASTDPIGDMDNIRSLAIKLPYNRTAMNNLVESYMRWQTGARTDLSMQGVKTRARNLMLNENATLEDLINILLSDKSFLQRKDHGESSELRAPTTYSHPKVAGYKEH